MDLGVRGKVALIAAGSKGLGKAVAEELAGRVTRRFVDYLRLLQPRDGETADPIDVQMEVETEVVEDDEAGPVPSAGRGPDPSAAEVPLEETETRQVPVDDPDATRAALRIPDEGHFNARGNEAVAALVLRLLDAAPNGAGS